MKAKNLSIAHLFLLTFFLHVEYVFSENKIEPEKQQGKSEERLSNGTVIGKYTYMDDDGTPIHVKYYADKSGYGVELKSIKIEVPGNNSDDKLEGFAKLKKLSNFNATTARYKNEFNLQPYFYNSYQMPNAGRKTKLSRSVRLRRRNRNGQ